MPTVITHAVVPLLIGAAAGRRTISPRLLAAGAIAAMLPDADVLAFKFGVAYADAFGHRGATHSIALALALAALAACAWRLLRTTPGRAFVFVGLAALSHPLLDALTDGGLGVALAWPMSAERFFFPWRPIEVSPIGARFFSWLFYFPPGSNFWSAMFSVGGGMVFYGGLIFGIGTVLAYAKFAKLPLGNLFDASGTMVKSFNTWDRSTLIQKYAANFYHGDATRVSLSLVKGDNGWQIATE